MEIRKVFTILLVLLFCAALTGCSGKDYSNYANAVKEQNVTLQLMAEKATAKQEAAQRKHEEKMLALTNNALRAAAETQDKSDDVVTPLVMMVLEDKWLTTRALADATSNKVSLDNIKAPETFGESVQKMGSTILGLGGIYLGITQSNNLADVAKSGITNAGTHNTASDGSSISSGDSSNANSNKPTDSYNTDTATEEPVIE